MEATPLWDQVDKYLHFRDRLLAILSSPESSGEAMDALLVLARWARYDSHDQEALAHLEQLSHGYTDEPELLSRLSGITHLGPTIAGPALRYLSANSKLLEIRDTALLELARSYTMGPPSGEAEALFEQASTSTLPRVKEEALRALYAMHYLQIGQQAPDIAGVGFDGGPLSTSQFRGKVVVLDFWGTWCGPCVKGLPKLATLRDRYASDLQVIGVNTDQDRSKLEVFLSQNPDYNWPQLLDGSSRGPVCQTWNVDGFPTYIVLDRRGVIRSKGELPEALLEQLVSEP